jgi:hypothetical protein
MTEVQAILQGMQALIAAMEKKESGGAGGRSRKTLEIRNVADKKFNGNMEDWTDWSFVFRRSIKANSVGAYEMMVKMEMSDPKAGPVDELGDLTVEEDKYSAELYDILCQVCEGDAMSILKNVMDCSGARAWQRLWRKYNPKTMARRIVMLTEVTGPARIADVKEVEKAINSWEVKYTKLHNEFNENLSDPMKIAIVLNMMPRIIQEHVYSHIGTEDTYENTIYKMKLMAGQKTAMDMGGLVPMDIGRVEKEKELEKEISRKLIETWQYEDEGEGEYGDMGAVGMNAKCHRCGGFGHMQRECATARDDRKGGKGKGKDGKGGFGKGSFGKGFA